MALKRIHIVLSIDKHIKFLKNALEKIKNIYPNDQVYLCNFNSGDHPIKLPLIAKKLNINYKTFVFPRVEKDRLVCAEIFAMLKISSYFYNLGYDEVYLLHGDIEIIGDYTESFNNFKKENWSVIVPLINFLQPLDKTSLQNLWLHNQNYSSQNIEKYSIARLTQSCLIFNKKYINEIQKNFNSFEDFFKDQFLNSSLYGDCALFDCNHFGFSVSPILTPISIEKRWLQNDSKILLKKEFETVKYIHIGN
jgi:hypothetical protein